MRQQFAPINAEEFLQVDIEKISKVYSGKRNCCRCGCGGTYTSTAFDKDGTPEDTNTELVIKRLNRAKKLVKAGAEYDMGSNYFDVKTGKNSTLTFYFDDLKTKNHDNRLSNQPA